MWRRTGSFSNVLAKKTPTARTTRIAKAITQPRCRRNRPAGAARGARAAGRRRGSSSVRSCTRAIAELREHLFLIEAEEAVLVGTDLVDVDVVVAGIDEALYALG